MQWAGDGNGDLFCCSKDDLLPLVFFSSSEASFASESNSIPVGHSSSSQDALRVGPTGDVRILENSSCCLRHCQKHRADSEREEHAVLLSLHTEMHHDLLAKFLMALLCHWRVMWIYPISFSDAQAELKAGIGGCSFSCPAERAGLTGASARENKYRETLCDGNRSYSPRPWCF